MRRKVHSLLLALVVGVALDGCAQDPFGPLADSLLGKDRQAAAPATAQPSPTQTCKAVAFQTHLDVDTAYARAMRRFKFETLEQKKQKMRDGLTMMDSGFKHDARPGAFYNMADLVYVQDGQGGLHSVWMEMELGKDGPARTSVSTRYCVYSADPRFADQAFYAYVDKSIHDSMK